MTALWYDLRYAFRVLLKNPGFTVAAVLALALGIGANSTIYSVINAVLLRPLPFNEPGRLAWVWETQAQLDRAPFTPADFLDYAAQNQSFEQLATYFSQNLTMTGAGEPERLRGAIVTANFFSTLGAEPIAGRTFLAEEGQPGAARVAVVSHGLWRRRFNSDPNLPGKDLTLNGVSFRVVGVMPAGFAYPNEATELWVNPLNILPEFSVGSTADVRAIRTSHFLPMIGRLKPGVTQAQAQADMEAVARRIGQQYNSTHGVRVVSMHERVVGDVRPVLLALLGAVALVLLIACANVANMMMARTTARRQEFAVRMAHGASRVQLLRQLLTESLLLAFLGCAAGLLLAYWGVNLLTSALSTELPRLKEISLDRNVLVFTVIVSALTGFVFGLAPALRASDVNLTESLKEGGRGSTEGLRRNRLRSLLVVFEVALSLVVLIGAGLLVKSFLRLQNVDPGFDPSNLLSLQVSLPAAKYKEPEQQAAFLQQLTQRLESLPGVQGIAVANDFPLDGHMQTSTPVIEGQGAPDGENSLSGVHVINHDYFRAMGIPLLKGRAFTHADVKDSPRVAIINAAMAQRLFPNREAVGGRIKFGGSTAQWREIVGVVGDVKYEGLDEKPHMETYVPILQSPGPIMALAVRTTTDPAAMTTAVRKAVLEVDQDQPIYDVKTMAQRLTASTGSRRLSMFLFASFAVVALLLAAVGVYGVMAYSVNRRTHEIGVRMALGARAADVLKLVLGQAMILALAGVVVGVAAALVATRLLSSLLYSVSATDPVTFVAIPLFLILVALLASYIPARRATKIDPLIALRYE